MSAMREWSLVEAAVFAISAGALRVLLGATYHYVCARLGVRDG